MYGFDFIRTRILRASLPGRRRRRTPGARAVMDPEKRTWRRTGAKQQSSLSHSWLPSRSSTPACAAILRAWRGRISGRLLTRKTASPARHATQSIKLLRPDSCSQKASLSFVSGAMGTHARTSRCLSSILSIRVPSIAVIATIRMERPCQPGGWQEGRLWLTTLSEMKRFV